MNGGRCAPLVLLLLLAAGCVDVTQLVVPPPAPLEVAAPAPPTGPAAGPRPFVGIEVEENTSGSLEDMTFGSGLRVASVRPGSPAEAAGLRRGDLITRADGQALDSISAWLAKIEGAHGGQSIALEVERDGGVSDVTVGVSMTGGALLPAPSRFVERRRARVVATTATLADARTAAVVTELLPGSPLADAGIGPGDAVLALDGRAVGDAQTLVRALGERDAGADVELEIAPAGAATRRSVSVGLLAPPRRLTRLAVPVLFSFERDLVRDRTEFSFVDVWLLALYDYRREGETRRHRILRFFVFESGVGTLSEESTP